ncbi:metallophosphoesterase [Dysgonomonas sp. BGC7]|uniref:metallophosphoesterase n=1 Tax=Dysgonomonas sp. BGC7 TaxID=1658008 RepID=UPI00068072DF|nr:metallophosphoesterase [Dysgonomonas sp. BGC7]MBD8389082.1 metallophosphoesterase [Dysgonomonas sp. BGC7]
MNWKKRLSIILALCLLLPCLCLGYAYFEARNVQLKKMSFSHKDIPESFDGKKIVFVSDIHFNRYFNKENLAEMVERINQCEPDIVVLGGDYVLKDSAYTRLFFEGLKQLKSTYGVYSVLGNHDHWEDADIIQQGLVDCGFNVSDNRSYWIKEGNDSIKIGGVGDFWTDVQLPENTIDDVKVSDFCILLSHNPDYLEILETDKVDLMLSGHTHAGQVTLFGLWAPIMPSTGHAKFMQTGMKYRYGWKERGNTRLYVTSGVGMGGFPLRFFAWPEIVEITLKRD